MIQNISKIAKSKARELRPRRKGLRYFGSHTVGVKKSTIDTYAV